VSISCAFTFRFFRKKKRYQIFQKIDAQPLHSPNLYTVVKNQPDLYNGKGIREVDELYMWDPSAVSGTVFRYFSPLQVIAFLAANDSDLMSCIYTIVFAVSIIFFTTFMCDTYTTWKKDQEIIFKQVIHY